MLTYLIVSDTLFKMVKTLKGNKIGVKLCCSNELGVDLPQYWQLHMCHFLSAVKNRIDFVATKYFCKITPSAKQYLVSF